MDLMSFVVAEWPLVITLVIMVSAFLMLESKKGGAVVTHHQATRLVNSGEAVFVDIRDSKDYRNGHIVDSINIPYADLSEKFDELSPHKQKQIIVVDKMGQQSGAGGKILRDNGFQVLRLNGGMSEWSHQNLPLVS